MTAVVELAGTHCAGKTSVARALAERGFVLVGLDALVCRAGNPYARQRCIVRRFSLAYDEVERLVAEDRDVVMDNSLLSVAAYNILFEVRDPLAPARLWTERVARITGKYNVVWVTVVLRCDCEELRRRCRERGRAGWEWEAETACHVDEILGQLLGSRWVAGMLCPGGQEGAPAVVSVDTTARPPEAVAETVLGILRGRW